MNISNYMSDKKSKSAKIKNLLIVDPNPEGSTVTNVEELSISVELKVFKRSDDIIIFDNTNNQTTQQTNGVETDTTRISFIDGSGDKKELTTNYTELNTNFNKTDQDLETLGIESIDISFNTSYTPIVKIRFKDIRGKLFEMGDKSPYGFLFRMPYPIFYLTIKGYYGKPVEYALHLMKFNGALDSDTGSFIISCDFIGYTYAFLSDLTMGYLRAIPFTRRGQGIIGGKGFENFINFDQLQKVITELGDYVIKFKKKDEKLKALTVYDDLDSKLDLIIRQLKSKITVVENGRTDISASNIVFTKESQDLSNFFTKDYESSVIRLVNEYNVITKETKARSFELTVSKFGLGSGGVYYKGFSVDDFIISNTAFNSDFNRFKTLDEFQNSSPVILNRYGNFVLTGKEKNDKIVEKLYEEFIQILKQPPFSSTVGRNDTRFNMLDIRFVIEQINGLREEMNNELIKNKNLVTEDFVSKLSDFFDEQGIDFDGSIGSFFRILCSHVDLFIGVLRDVGLSIKTDMDNGNRTIQGSNKDSFSEYEDNDGSTINIKAFPEYVGKEDGALVEKWLGSNPKFNEFKEVAFIDDLLNSIIKAEVKDQAYLLNVRENEKGWYPVNPLETKAFNSLNTNPWLIPNDSLDIYLFKLLYQRMVLFLSYTNKNVTKDEINKMAKLEARQMYGVILDDGIKNGIVSNETKIEGVDGKIANLSKQIRQKFGLEFVANDTTVTIGLGPAPITFSNIFQTDKLSYRHTSPETLSTTEDFDILTETYIPINQSLLALKNSFNILNSVDERSAANTFVSSMVSNAQVDDNIPNPVEGFETFIEIIKPSSYSDGFLYDYDSDLEIDPLVKNFNGNDNDAGKTTADITKSSKIFGGVYRTHEFLLYEHETAGTIPLFYEFYENGDDTVYSFRKNSIQNEYDTFIDDDNGGFRYNEGRVILNNADKIRLFGNYDVKKFKEQLIENISKGNITKRDFKLQPTFKSSGDIFSLFGSEFYYRQSNIGKAFLFLHTLPFIGMGEGRRINKGLLNRKELNFFNQRGGFVSVPYAWILFMGGLLYRNGEENDFLIFNDADNESLIPKNDISGFNISKNKYLVSSLDNNLSFINASDDNVINYPHTLNDIITRFPDKVKKQFIETFENWVNRVGESGWLELKNNLEIFDDNAGVVERNNTWNDFSSVINTNVLKTNIANNYSVVSKDSQTNGEFVLDLRDGSDAANGITNLLLEERIIINSTYRIWEASETRFSNFDIPAKTADNYLETFFEEFKKLNASNVIDPNEELKKKLFNSTDDDDIKLSLYKNMKSIYEKWVVGVPQNKSGVVSTNLYEKFNFIDRSYTDIADKFKIAPTTFVNYWKDNTNISFYNFIARILKSNNFDFIPLPTYINWNNKEEIKEVFEPFRFNEAQTTSGPSFVCMYFGEQSNKLDIDKNNEFKKNDSWSLDIKYKKGDISVSNLNDLPEDFASGTTKVPYFIVKYADQNQSLFKSFNLDQSEFTETQESLEAIESISHQNRNSSIGQNLFDIYNNRAYSCEVEMLGCAQIQPFMYFQLDNIPMFNGAYNIINTRHSIKANHMTTTFKGVRVRAVKTKMIDDRTLYSHLISNLNEVSKEGASLDAFSLEDSVVKIKTTIEPALITTTVNGLITIENRFNGIIIED
jgi:hypothetical protein